MKSSNILVICLSFFLSLSCTDDPLIENNTQHLDNTKNDSLITIVDTTNNTYFDDCLIVTKYASNSRPHQSSASFNDYLILVTQNRKTFFLYNISTKAMLCKSEMEAGLGYSYTGSDLYHCNQASFGVDFYDSNDFFPLLYISQRATDDKRCFVECFRIIPHRVNLKCDYSSIEIQLIQIIYFPIMTKDNSLGNVNCVIDQEKRLLYTYSRNNNIKDTNYGICRITCFNIPEYNNPVVLLEDSDIIDSFQIDCSAIFMQGGCIKDGFLYIGQGYKSVGQIYMNVIDLIQRKLSKHIDLLNMGITWEPEGCFIYQDRIMVSSNDKNIWYFNFI